MSEKPADYAVGICQRTGFKVKAEDLVEEWTGLMVRRSSCDPRHPLLDVPVPRGEELRDSPTGPESDNDIGDGDPPPALNDLWANN